MKVIKLTKGKECLVDDADYETLSTLRWHANMGRYAARTVKQGGRKITVLMHRLLGGATKWGQYVDHVNGNTLDNRRENLRLCSNAENVRNQRPIRKRKSKYKGVSLKGRSTWTARITVNYQEIYLGSFRTEREAALAYNAAALKHFGQFANLNIVEDENAA